MDHKLPKDMEIWKGKGNRITLPFSLKGLEILHQKRRGQVNTILIEHFKSILFHKFRPTNKLHTYQLSSKASKINNTIYCNLILSTFERSFNFSCYYSVPQSYSKKLKLNRNKYRKYRRKVLFY